jgi:hypothetical protein
VRAKHRDGVHSTAGASSNSRGRKAVVKLHLRQTRPEGPTFHPATIIYECRTFGAGSFGLARAHGLTAVATP